MAIELPGEVAQFLQFIGINWPQINEDKVREFASHVREFAQNIDDTHQQATATVKAMGQHYQANTYVRLRAVLRELAGSWGTSSEQALPDVVAALLDFGSETPDNIAMASELAVVTADGLGLGLWRCGVRLSQLLAHAVGSDVPKEFRENFPEIDKAEWTAALRITQAVLEALEPSDDPARQRLSDSLWKIGDQSEPSRDQLRDAVATEIVACHPTDPGFLDAVRRLRVCVNDDFATRSIGLCVAESGALLSDLFWLASESAMPDKVAAALPGLRQSEWEAAMLAVRLELIALETEAEALDEDL
jgi:hypothetical protein